MARDRATSKKTSANRDIKLETKMSKVGTPTGYRWGLVSQGMGKKESIAVINMLTRDGSKIKGPSKTLKENTVKAIFKADKLPYESPAKFKQRIIADLMKNPSKPIPNWVSATQKAKIKEARAPKTLPRNKVTSRAVFKNLPKGRAGGAGGLLNIKNK
jgi:hypothetical protein